MKPKFIKVLLAVYCVLFVLACFGLSVPPHDFTLYLAMSLLSIAGLALSWVEGKKWRWLWIIALSIAILGGILEIVAGEHLEKKLSGDAVAVLQTIMQNSTI